MLQQFIADRREEIITRVRNRVEGRIWPLVTADELENGVPLFLEQLSETLRLETTATPFPNDAIGSTAALHGADLLAAGYNVSQVVHDYGDICQVITEIAIEEEAPITVPEFRTLNACLDTAIAQAVTEHSRIKDETRSVQEIEHVGRAAHELRNYLNTAILAFQTLKRGDVGINGNTGAVLGHSLMSLRDVIGGAVSEVRLTAGKHRRERVPVMTLIDEIAAAGVLHAEYQGIGFSVEPVDPNLAVDADPQLLTSALNNLLQNAFKYTPRGGHVSVRARGENGELLVEIEDACGGFPDDKLKANPFEPFGERRGADRSGLGLGLSIARKAVRAHGGDIQIRNLPGKGCIFVVEMPLFSDARMAADAI